MAIAFDTATDGGRTGSAASLTYSHTVTGSNPFLVVLVLGAVSTDNITGVTYNTVAMTLRSKTHLGSGTDRWLYAFYLFAPATGAHNVVVSSSPSEFIASGTASYIGVLSTVLDNTGDTVNSSSPLTNTITSIANNCWHIGVGGAASGQPAASTGTTRRVLTASDNGAIFDNNAAITPAGSNSLVMTASSGLSMLGFTISPTAPINSNFLTFM